MAGYQVKRTDPAVAEINVPDNQLGSLPDLSIGLVGRNYVNYSPAISTIEVHMLENFASPAEPENGITGQLWYDKSLGILKVASAEGPAVWEELIHDGMSGGGFTIGNSGPGGSFDAIYGTDVYADAFHGNIDTGNIVGDIHYGDQVALTPSPTNLICHVDPGNFGTSYVWRAVLPDDTLISFMQVTEFPSGLMNSSWGIKGTKAPQIAMSNDDAETAPFMQLKVGDNTLKTFITLNEDKINVTGDMHFSSDSSIGDPSKIIFRDDGDSFNVNTIEWQNKNGDLISYMRGWHPLGIFAPNVNVQHAEFEMPIPGTFDRAGVTFTHDFDDDENRARFFLADKEILIDDDEIRIDANGTRILAVSDFYLGYENSWDAAFNALVFQDANGSQNGAGMTWKRDDAVDFASLTSSYYSSDNSYTSTWESQDISIQIYRNNHDTRIKMGGFNNAYIELQSNGTIKALKDDEDTDAIVLIKKIDDNTIALGESVVDVVIGRHLILGAAYTNYSKLIINDIGSSTGTIEWNDGDDVTISSFGASRGTTAPNIRTTEWIVYGENGVGIGGMDMAFNPSNNVLTMTISAAQVFIGPNDFKTTQGASGEVLTANGDGTVSWGFTAEGPGGNNWLDTAELLGTATGVDPGGTGEYSSSENFQAIVEQAAGRAIYTVSGGSNTVDTMNPIAAPGQASHKTLFDGLTIFHIAQAPTVGGTELFIDAFGLGTKEVSKTFSTANPNIQILTEEIRSGAFYTYTTNGDRWLMHTAIGNQHLVMDSYINILPSPGFITLGDIGEVEMSYIGGTTKIGTLTRQAGNTNDWSGYSNSSTVVMVNLTFQGLDEYDHSTTLSLNGTYLLHFDSTEDTIVLHDPAAGNVNWVNSALPTLNNTNNAIMKPVSNLKAAGVYIPWTDFERIEMMTGAANENNPHIIVGSSTITKDTIKRNPSDFQIRAYSFNGEYAGIEATSSYRFKILPAGDAVTQVIGWVRRRY